MLPSKRTTQQRRKTFPQLSDVCWTGRNKNGNLHAGPGRSPNTGYRHALARGSRRLRDHGGKVVGRSAAQWHVEGNTIVPDPASLKLSQVVARLCRRYRAWPSRYAMTTLVR